MEKYNKSRYILLIFPKGMCIASTKSFCRCLKSKVERQRQPKRDMRIDHMTRFLVTLNLWCYALEFINTDTKTETIAYCSCCSNCSWQLFKLFKLFMARKVSKGWLTNSYQNIWKTKTFYTSVQFTFKSDKIKKYIFSTESKEQH